MGTENGNGDKRNKTRITLIRENLREVNENTHTRTRRTQTHDIRTNQKIILRFSFGENGVRRCRHHPHRLRCRRRCCLSHLNWF